MSFHLSDLSKFRSSFMGFAMIWIVLYHYQIKGLLAFPIGNGFTGVDIFMFVSGMGLYYSMTKDSNMGHFYKKRFLRIFPLYYLIGLAYVLIEGGFGFWNYLWRFSTLGFWTDGTIGNGWFIPSIVAVYVFYPFVHITVFRNGIDKTALIVLGAILLFFIGYTSFVDLTIIDTNHYLLLYRLPVFLFGMLIGYSISKNKDFSRRFIHIALALLPLFLIHFVVHDNIRIRYLSTTFTVPLIMAVICVLLNYFKRVQTMLGGGRKCILRNLYATSYSDVNLGKI